MKVKTACGTRAQTTRRALTLGAAALLVIGSLAAQAWDPGQGRGSGIDQSVPDWGYGPGSGRQSMGSFNRFGEISSPGLERQSRFQGPGRHRVSGFGQAPSSTPGRFVHRPGSGGRGR